MLDFPSKMLCKKERSEVLQQWDDWLEIPMLVLGFTWLGLFIVELVGGADSSIESDRWRHLDCLYCGFWHQISSRSLQNFLPQAQLADRFFTVYSSAANFSDCEYLSITAISSCRSRIVVAAVVLIV